jgi:energy-coupling factor transporter transmembrane protein EcfT
MTASMGVWLESALVSRSARGMLAAIGVVLLCFFAMVFLAAFASGSWPGLLIASYLLVASVCSFRYAWSPKRWLLFVVAPALLFLFVMLSGVVFNAVAT